MNNKDNQSSLKNNDNGNKHIIKNVQQRKLKSAKDNSSNSAEKNSNMVSVKFIEGASRTAEEQRMDVIYES